MVLDATLCLEYTVFEAHSRFNTIALIIIPNEKADSSAGTLNMLVPASASEVSRHC